VLDLSREKKEADADFGLVLAKPLNTGEGSGPSHHLRRQDAVRDPGNDNYDPIARGTWFPNGGSGFGSYTTYKMLFHIPKNLQLIATEPGISDKVEGKMRTSAWETKMPLPVVGFHLGPIPWKRMGSPRWAGRVRVLRILRRLTSRRHSQCNNRTLPSGDGYVGGAALGNLSTTGMLRLSFRRARSRAESMRNTSASCLSTTRLVAAARLQLWTELADAGLPAHCGFWDAPSSTSWVAPRRPVLEDGDGS